MSQASSSIPGALSSGQAALSASVSKLDQAAAKVATPGQADVVNPLLQADQAALQARAAVQVIKTANSLLGTLLDIYA